MGIAILDKDYCTYLEKKYNEIHTGYNDIMYYFVYKGIKLLNNNGHFGFITSNYYLGNSNAKLLRNNLKNYVDKIINFKNYYVFKGVNIHTNIIIAQKNAKSKEVQYYEKKNDKEINTIELNNYFTSFELKRNNLNQVWFIANSNDLDILKNLSINCNLLGEISEIEKGSTSGKNEIFTVSNRLAKKNKFESELLRKNVKNSDVSRYHINERGNFLIYIENDTNIKMYPNIYRYLLNNKKILLKRNEVKRGLYKWYRLERPRKKYIFDSSEKLIVPYRASENKFAYDDKQYFNDGGDIRVIVLKENIKININIKYVLGLLNSNLINWYYKFIGKPKGNSYEYFNKPLALIPIKQIDFNNKEEKETHNSIVKFVDDLLKLKKDLHATTLTTQREQIQRAIDHAERKIDEIVYELYGLTEEEVRIIEEL